MTPGRRMDVAIAACAFAAVAMLSTFVPIWHALDRKLFDALTVMTASHEAAQPIVDDYLHWSYNMASNGGFDLTHRAPRRSGAPAVPSSPVDGLVGRLEGRLMKWQPAAGETEKL